MAASDVRSSDASPTPQKPPRRWKKPVLIGLAMALLVAATPLGLHYYHTSAADEALREAMTETDRLDPGWRLEALEGHRAVLPEAENSAFVIRRVKTLIPPDWGAHETFWKLFQDDEPPEAQLNPEQVKLLRAELAKAGTALQEARKLKDLPRGRFPIGYARDWISTNRDHLQDTRAVAYLLMHLALLQSQEGAVDDAVRSCQALLNCARCFHDDPSLASALIRISQRAIACGAIERALAQGQPSDKALAALQELLEKEQPAPLALIGFRGERAGMDCLLEAAQTGACSPKEIETYVRFSGKKLYRSDEERTLLLTPMGLKHLRAAVLRCMNQIVEAGRLPFVTRAQRLRQLEADFTQQAPLVQLLTGTPACVKVAESERRSAAMLRSVIAGIAAERYRHRHGRWPSPPELIAKGYLRTWPLDPYDGAPLRCKRLKDGLVIYSLGPDGIDNGGKLRRASDEPSEEPQGFGGLDLGIRLWDVAQRRQPPQPPRPPPPGPPDEEPGAVPGRNEP